MMDLGKIGGFLASLRHERGWTQAALGERLGVSGKTVSRWETGTYLPPVEMLQALSELYGVSINELICGERIAPEQLPAQAEKALVSVMRETPFLLHERQAFWRRKWRRDHRAFLALFVGAAIAVQLAAALTDNGRLMTLGTLLILAGVMTVRCWQEEYVEHHLYDE